MDANDLWRSHKPKWRPARSGVWHCYLTFGRKYEALCGRKWPAGMAIGTTCSRPPCPVRCMECDLQEIKLGKAEESYLESPGWERQL